MLTMTACFQKQSLDFGIMQSLNQHFEPSRNTDVKQNQTTQSKNNHTLKDHVWLLIWG